MASFQQVPMMEDGLADEGSTESSGRFRLLRGQSAKGLLCLALVVGLGATVVIVAKKSPSAASGTGPEAQTSPAFAAMADDSDLEELEEMTPTGDLTQFSGDSELGEKGTTEETCQSSRRRCWEPANPAGVSKYSRRRAPVKWSYNKPCSGQWYKASFGCENHNDDKCDWEWFNYGHYSHRMRPQRCKEQAYEVQGGCLGACYGFSRSIYDGECLQWDPVKSTGILIKGKKVENLPNDRIIVQDFCKAACSQATDCIGFSIYVARNYNQPARSSTCKLYCETCKGMPAGLASQFEFQCKGGGCDGTKISHGNNAPETSCFTKDCPDAPGGLAIWGIGCPHGPATTTTPEPTCDDVPHSQIKDCVYHDWAPWASCSKTCGGGTRERKRNTTAPNECGDKCKPDWLSEAIECNVHNCPQNCVLGEWTNWTVCTKTCGKGTSTRTRKVTTPPAHGGAPCDKLKEEKPCNDKCCPVDCEMSDWHWQMEAGSKWTKCSASCGHGYQVQQKSPKVSPECKGQCCVGPFGGVQKCKLKDCDSHCETGDWGAWAACSATCGVGTQMRKRPVTRCPSSNGTECPELSEVKTCKAANCTGDCQLGEWQSWGACHASHPDACSGLKFRHRNVLAQPIGPGKPCADMVGVGSCNMPGCSPGCKVSDWNHWSACSVTCGMGGKYRTRRIVKLVKAPGTNNSKNPCPELVDTGDCKRSECPVDCELSEWSAWAGCTEERNGFRTRNRKILKQPSGCSGKPCGLLKESENCNIGPCQRDCVVGTWGPWSKCSPSSSAGGGVKFRSRPVTTQPHGGNPCGELAQFQDCPDKTDCVEA